MTAAVVTTTIRYPESMIALRENAEQRGYSIEMCVVGDRKTPDEVKQGPWTYLGLEEQKKLSPELYDFLPLDSIQRRNFGMLWAYRKGFDVIITVDDDNFPIEGVNWVGEHTSVVGQPNRKTVVESKTGWVNVCRRGEFYPRGFPLGERGHDGYYRGEASDRIVAVNQGLWQGDPDVDAVTRIAHGEITSDGAWPSVALGIGQWCPFNSQNTAMMREVIPAYFLEPQWKRYDDIWAGYIVTKIAHHLGHVISFGAPVVEQRRNQHDLWKDLEEEMMGMRGTDEFCRRLRETKLTGKTYHECYGEIGGNEVWHSLF